MSPKHNCRQFVTINYNLHMEKTSGKFNSDESFCLVFFASLYPSTLTFVFFFCARKLNLFNNVGLQQLIQIFANI